MTFAQKEDISQVVWFARRHLRKVGNTHVILPFVEYGQPFLFSYIAIAHE